MCWVTLDAQYKKVRISLYHHHGLVASKLALVSYLLFFQKSISVSATHSALESSLLFQEHHLMSCMFLAVSCISVSSCLG